MPEGPEIRRAADRIGRVLVGRTLSEVYFGLERLKPFEGMLRGATVETLTTHGKAMLTHFTNGLTLYSHNQLYGRWYVCRRGRTPATTRTLRVGLHTAAASALLFSACGGGGGSGGTPPVTGPPPGPTPGFVALQSAPGDFIGDGLDYRYTQADARLLVSTLPHGFQILVRGDEEWFGVFELPDTFTQVEVGVYSNLGRYPFHDPVIGGMTWSGEGRQCDQRHRRIVRVGIEYIFIFKSPAAGLKIRAFHFPVAGL